MSIKRLKVEEFTVFKDFDIEFSDGVNVIIGENGTGKTQYLR